MLGLEVTKQCVRNTGMNATNLVVSSRGKYKKGWIL
jgi:hypothetical protein